MKNRAGDLEPDGTKLKTQETIRSMFSLRVMDLHIHISAIVMAFVHEV